MTQDAAPRLLFSVTAALLFALGAPLLFAGDVTAAWLGVRSPAGEALAQLAAAGLLGLGAANWWSRGGFVGGIYGRPLGLGNLLCFVAIGTSLGRAALAGDVPGATWAVVAAATLLAFVFAWRLFFWRPAGARGGIPGL